MCICVDMCNAIIYNTINMYTYYIYKYYIYVYIYKYN